MIIKILGSSGGVSPGNKSTSYLIDGKLLIDAGSVASALSLEEQARVQWILISHTHLDHIKDLAFICDNCFGMKSTPYEVYSAEQSIHIIKTHLLNDMIWPDFTKLPNSTQPTIRLNPFQENQPLTLGEYTILPIKVNHPNSALGFIIQKGEVSLLFTQDTGPTDLIWKEAHKQNQLKAIFTEVSFPNELLPVARESQHHTPSTLALEMHKMPPSIPLYVGHLKPNFRQILEEEIGKIGSDRIHILLPEGQTIVF